MASTPARRRGEHFGFNDSVFIPDVLSPPSSGGSSSGSGGSYLDADDSLVSDLSLLETMGSPTVKPTNRTARPLPSEPWSGDVRTVHLNLADYPECSSFGFFLRGWEAPADGAPKPKTRHDEEAAKRYVCGVGSMFLVLDGDSFFACTTWFSHTRG